MTPRASPYLLFFLALGVFLLANSLLSAVLPVAARLIASELIAFVALALYFRSLPQQEPVPEWPGLLPAKGRVGPLSWVALLVLGPVVGLTANACGGLAVTLIPGMAEVARAQTAAYEELLRNQGPWLAALGVASATIVAPISEELMFRGAILPASRAWERRWVAICVNGLLFGALHMSPLSIVPLSLLGALLADLTLRTRSLLPAILVHASMNTFNGVILPALVTQGDPVPTAPWYELALQAGVLLGVSGLAWWGMARWLGRES